MLKRTESSSVLTLDDPRSMMRSTDVSHAVIASIKINNKYLCK